MRGYLVILASVFLLSACQAPLNIQQLENKNQSLQQQLDKANKQIGSLQQQHVGVQAELTKARSLIGVLDQEKAARISESSTLRSQIRRFVQKEIDGLKGFLVNSNLLDYIGGELISRAYVDEKPIMLVDLANKMPRRGVLTGMAGKFAKPTSVVIKVLRPVEDKLVVIWESRPLQVKRAGLVKYAFPVTIGVEKGDVVGYYFPTVASVYFDEGSGDTRFLHENMKPGSSTRVSSLSGQSRRRSYSIGVYALLR